MALWNGRYTLPYFDGETGRPIYSIFRSLDPSRGGWGDGDEDKHYDYHGDRKYTKTKSDPEWAMMSEPIYGRETIVEGEPLVITEGMPDAISAHQKGIPCISPVTTKFDDDQYEILVDILQENNIPRIDIVNDFDPDPTTVESVYRTEYAEQYDQTRLDDNTNNVNKPKSADGIEDLEDIIDIHNYGPGFKGAVKSGQYLDNAATGDLLTSEGSEPLDREKIKSEPDSAASEIPERYREEYETADTPPETTPDPTPNRSFEVNIVHLEPPYIGKYDLDEYLIDELYQYCPPALWVKNDIIEQEEQAEWAEGMIESGEIKTTTPETYNTYSDHYNYDPTTGPPIATTINHIHSVAPASLPSELDSGKRGNHSDEEARAKANSRDISSGSSSNKLFNLTIYDVLGLREGFRGMSPFGHYGDSKDYFYVMNDQSAYDHKSEVTYNPITSMLVLCGERDKKDPEGPLSKKEMFKAWEYARKQHIVEAKIPNKALIYFALKEGVATPDDVKLRETETGGSFESLDSRIYYKAIDKLKEKYEFNIVREGYEEKEQNKNEKEKNKDNKNNKNTQTNDDGESTTRESDDGGVESSANESSDEPADLDEQSDEVATNPEGGVSIEHMLGDSASDNESASTNTEDEPDQPTTETEDPDHESTRFHTYKPPTDSDDVDVDEHALNQFVEHHATVGEPDQKQMKTGVSNFVDIFDEWAKINSIELEKLSEDTADNMRKSAFRTILNKHHNIEKVKARLDGKQAYVFRPIILSEEVSDLAE